MHTSVKPAELTLTNGDDSIIIRPRPATAGNPIMCRTWDLGAPDVRFQSVPNPGADGVTESVGFAGSRQVTFDLAVLGGPDPATGDTHDAYWYVAKLVRMAHPGSQPILTITRDDETTGGETWRMVLRGNPYTLTYGKTSAALIELSLSFICPLGLLESHVRKFNTPTRSMGSRTDWVFPATFPKGFGMVGSANPVTLIPVGGDAPVQPTFYINGPAVNPEIRSGDDRFTFNNLTLTGGQSVKIDMASGDILLSHWDGRQIPNDMSAYGSVDWTVSTYWTWTPGVHQLIFYSETGSVRAEFSERRMTM